jgi:hypothetical protein
LPHLWLHKRFGMRLCNIPLHFLKPICLLLKLLNSDSQLWLLFRYICPCLYQVTNTMVSRFKRFMTLKIRLKCLIRGHPSDTVYDRVLRGRCTCIGLKLSHTKRIAR